MSSERLHAVLPPGLAGLRLDRALAEVFPGHSRSRIQRSIRFASSSVVQAVPRSSSATTRALPGTAARSRRPSFSTPCSIGVRLVRFDGAISWSSSESSGGIRRAYSRYPSCSHPVRR